MVEQFPPDFINALKAIIKSVDNNPYAITEAMNISKQDARMDAYYTFEIRSGSDISLLEILHLLFLNVFIEHLFFINYY